MKGRILISIAIAGAFFLTNCGGVGGGPTVSPNGFSLRIAPQSTSGGGNGEAVFQAIAQDIDILKLTVQGTSGGAPYSLETDLPPTARSTSMALPIGSNFSISAVMVQKMSGKILYAGQTTVKLVAGDNSATLPLDPQFTIYGRAVDSSGNPIPNAVVTTGDSNTQVTAVTSSSGFFYLFNAGLSGDHVFDASLKDYATGHTLINLGSGLNNVGDIILGTAPAQAFPPAIDVYKLEQPTPDSVHLCAHINYPDSKRAVLIVDGLETIVTLDYFDNFCVDLPLAPGDHTLQIRASNGMGASFSDFIHINSSVYTAVTLHIVATDISASGANSGLSANVSGLPASGTTLTVTGGSGKS